MQKKYRKTIIDTTKYIIILNISEIAYCLFIKQLHGKIIGTVKYGPVWNIVE